MENIVLTTLKEKLQKLQSERWKKGEDIDKLFNDEVKNALVKIDSMFNDWNVRINDSDIQIDHPEISSFGGSLRIKFPQKYTEGKYIYGEPTLAWKSVEIDKDREIDLGIMIGILCKEQRIISEVCVHVVGRFFEKKN